MSGVVEKKQVGMEIPRESSLFIYNTLKERYKNNPPSPRTAMLAAALMYSGEPFTLKSESQGNKTKKPIVGSTYAVNTVGVKGAKVENRKGSRMRYGIPYGEEALFKGRRIWTSREDEFIRRLVVKHGTGSWSLVAECLATQYSIFGRTGKQCWER